MQHTEAKEGAKKKPKRAAKSKPKTSVQEAPLPAGPDSPVLAQDIIGAVNYYTRHVGESAEVEQLNEKLLGLCVEFALEGSVRCLGPADLKKLKQLQKIRLAYLVDPAEAQAEAIAFFKSVKMLTVMF